jgi:tetratricopeptide (TPR) repeat protein
MSTGVDLTFVVDHNYALALRDSGHPEEALPIFLDGRILLGVIDPHELEEARTGDYYGNIGRCLHLMGQIDQALVCYQKSALLLEKATGAYVTNQGFIRGWIAELLVARNQLSLAYAFYRAAYRKWERTAPPRAAIAEQLAMRLKNRLEGSKKPDDESAERLFLDWILGKHLDA